MDVSVLLPPVTPSLAVEGMRPVFLRAFGRSFVSRALGQSAWESFRTALLHSTGLSVAASHALLAAEYRNRHVMLVARWSSTRIRAAVDRAVCDAMNAA